MKDRPLRIGCDIGGTFTDFVLLDERSGELATYKCLTTPADPSDAVLEGMNQLAGGRERLWDELDELVHGTTLVINAIIERRGARTGLLTTRGFRDVLELGRGLRYSPYDVFAEFPRPLVPRHLRREVDERIASDGRVLQPLDRAGAERVIDELLAAGVESLAICLLNSFENPAHERQLLELVERRAPGLSVSVSSDVLPQIREYERTSTTVANAYVKPLTGSYLERLAGRLRGRGFAGKLFVMLSSGCITSVETAARYPVRIIESGPTAAVMAAQRMARELDIDQLFCFDMGGTTAKSCLVQQGRAGVVQTFEVGRVQRFARGSGLAIQVPVVDLMEIGAGGGSIARVSRLGTLQVGPRSAGAEPGPACYGRGGVEPTVTDADLLLGYLDPDYFLGGRMGLDGQAARRAVEERVAGPLGVSFQQAISGIHDVINETMAAAAKTHIAEKGGNPSQVTIAAFGGAGPVHAAGLARKLGARRLLVPPHAGVGSAMGFFAAPRAFDLVRSHKVELAGARLEELEDLFRRLEAEGEAVLRTCGAAAGMTCARSLDMRFVGQGFETTVDLPAGPLPELGGERLRELFDDLYRRLYGRTYPESPVEVVNLRVRASLPERPFAFRASRPAAAAPVAGGERPAWDFASGAFIPHTVYRRADLEPGRRMEGPAVIQEPESTTVVPAGARAWHDEHGYLWVDLGGEGP